ncbi:MAG: tetratricopeptide repeat protein [Bacteroidales bacterium]|nr:tetratricopeptide repeat protein [Bacteroidales bacterium]
MKYWLLILLIPTISFAGNNTMIDSLENRLNSVSGEEKFDILYQLARIYSMKNPEKSILYGQELFNIADSLQNDTLIINSLNALAIINFYLGENFEGLKYQNQMITMLEKIISDDPGSAYFKRKIASAYNNAGTLLDDLGEREEAIKKFFLAEKYASELLEVRPNDEDLIDLKISLLNNIGLLFYHTDSPGKGIDFIKDALDLSEKYNSDEKIAMSLNNLGLMQISQDDLNEALVNYKRALNINFSLGDSITIGGNYHNLGWIYEKKKQNDSALYYYNKSLAISKRMQYPYGISNTLCNIGYVRTQTGDLTNAEISLTQSLEIAVNADIMELQEKIYNNLYELFRKKGNYNKACDYQKKYHQVADSLFTVNISNQLAYWQTQYETEKKEKEILALNKETEIQKFKIGRKNSQLIWLLVGSVSLLIFVIVIFIMYRQRDKAYRNIVKQNLKFLKIEKKLEENIIGTPETISEIPAGPDDKHAELVLRLEKFLIEEKPYLWSEINMEEFCKKLITNRSYLSKVINDKYEQGFNDLISEYRIRTARGLLTNPEKNHISVEGIGQLAGFKSNSTFHEKFKKLVGLTPHQFRSRVLKQ